MPSVPSGPACAGRAAAPCNTEHDPQFRQQFDDSVQSFLPINNHTFPPSNDAGRDVSFYKICQIGHRLKTDCRLALNLF